MEARTKEFFNRFDPADADNIPEQLRRQNQWVVWREAPALSAKAKPRKVPVNAATLANADHTDPANWCSFRKAVEVFRKHPKLAGIGFSFSPDDPYCGIDLDNCRDKQTGGLEPYAEELVRLAGSYAEISPSETGVKIYLIAKLGDRKNHFEFSGHEIEAYDQGRFFVITGKRLPEAPAALREAQSTLDELHPPGAPRAQQPPEWDVSKRPKDAATATVDALTDEELIRRISASNQGAKFKALMADDKTGYPGYFAASGALCTILAAWTRLNPARIDRIYRTSAMYEQSWWEERCYRGRRSRAEVTVSESCALAAAGKWLYDAETLETTLVTERFSDIVAKPIVWLWPERVPAKKLTIFSGNPDEGKTTALCDTVSRYTTGRDWPDGAKNDLPPGDVLILNAEDDPADTLKPRLMAAGADLSRVHYLRCVRVSKGAKKEERMLALDTDLTHLEQMLKANPSIKLVGIDPITGYLGRADMNKEQELRRVLMPITELAERSGITFVALGHFNKRSDVRAIHRIGGAVAMSGVARSVLLFMRDPKAVEPNKYLMLLGKGNLTRKRTGLKYGFAEKTVALPNGSTTTAPVIEWCGDATDDAETVLEVAANSKGKAAARAGEFLHQHLAGKGEITADWIEAEAAKHHVSRNALFDAKKEHGIRALRKNGKWWWVWDGSQKPDSGSSTGLLE